MCIDLRFFFVQVLVDGPSTEEQKIVPRHVLPLAHATLTHFTIPQLPRAAGTGPVKKLWAKNEIDGKWAKSSFSQRTDRSERRKNLSDFERFKVLRLRKQVCGNIERGIRSGTMRLGLPDRIIWGITNRSTNNITPGSLRGPEVPRQGSRCQQVIDDYEVSVHGFEGGVLEGFPLLVILWQNRCMHINEQQK